MFFAELSAVDNAIVNVAMEFDEHDCHEIEKISCNSYSPHDHADQIIVSQQVCGSDGVTYQNQ